MWGGFFEGELDVVVVFVDGGDVVVEDCFYLVFDCCVDCGGEIVVW